MKKSTLGEIIYFYRNQKQISQAQLCQGICSVSTMSRIENGELDIPMLFSETLLERMGITANKFELMFDDEDCRHYTMRCAMEEAVKGEQILLAESLIKDYRKQLKESDKLDLQYLAFLKVQMMQKKKSKSEEIRKYLEQAAEYTVDWHQGKKLLLSQREIDILLTISKVKQWQEQNRASEKIENCASEEIENCASAEIKNCALAKTESCASEEIENCTSKKRKNPESEEILLLLKEYVETYNSLELQEKNLPKIQRELASLYAKQGRYEEAMEQAETGLQRLYGGRNYQYTADLHFIYAKSLWQKSKGSSHSEEICETCAQRCLLAYYLYEFDQDKKVEEVGQYLGEELKWEYTV